MVALNERAGGLAGQTRRCCFHRHTTPPPTHTPPHTIPNPQAFRERLGLILEREDEMGCMVDGCNFLLRAGGLREGGRGGGRGGWEGGHKAPPPPPPPPPQHNFVDMPRGQGERGGGGAQGPAVGVLQQHGWRCQARGRPPTAHPPLHPPPPVDLYPYLLVSIGSGVSMVRVDGEGSFQRVSGERCGGRVCVWGGGWGALRVLALPPLAALGSRPPRASTPPHTPHTPTHLTRPPRRHQRGWGHVLGSG